METKNTKKPKVQDPTGPGATKRKPTFITEQLTKFFLPNSNDINVNIDIPTQIRLIQPLTLIVTEVQRNYMLHKYIIKTDPNSEEYKPRTSGSTRHFQLYQANCCYYLEKRPVVGDI